MVLKTTNYTIEQSKKIKVLGVYITSGLSNEATVNDMISKINFRLHLIKKVIKYSNYRTAKMVMNSIVLSVFNYGSPLLINSNVRSLQKLNTLLIKCTRPILGFESYKWSVQKIMSKMKWQTFYHTVVYESIMFIHKSIFENIPKTITELVTQSLNNECNIRSGRKFLVIREPKSNKERQTLIYKSIFLYNTLPDIFKTYNPKKLKKYLREYIFHNFPNNSIPKNENI